MEANWKNKLCFGDNLPILREHVADESVDLIYLDPPFNSKATYSTLFKERSGTVAATQTVAFKDFWRWDTEAEKTYYEIITSSPQRIANLTQALRTFLGQSNMLAYLTMMAIRLVELHRVLKPTGSIYLHCDPTASHYLKLVMDAVFGANHYRNEIVWKRTSGHSNAVRCGRVHDVILMYGGGDTPVWNQLYQEYTPEYVEQYYRFTDSDGRRFKSGDLSAPGPQGGGYEYEWNGHTKVWRCPISTMQQLHDEGNIYYTRNGIPRRKGYLDEARGLPLQDIWADIQPLRSWHRERLGYPTQKPEALLERIIQASSNEGDLVLDPFCGSGTTMVVSEHLRRRWVGIDATHIAIPLIKDRLQDTFAHDLNPFEVIGEPD